MVDDGYVPPRKSTFPVMGSEGQGMAWANLFNLTEGGYVPNHMAHITKNIAYVLAGGDVIQGTVVSEQHILDLEREAFVELWKTENTVKMAEHILNTGKPLFI